MVSAIAREQRGREGQRSMQIVVAHPGTQHSWQTAYALQQLGRLKFYATSIFYQPERWPYRIERYLPAPLKRRDAKLKEHAAERAFVVLAGFEAIQRQRRSLVGRTQRGVEKTPDPGSVETQRADRGGIRSEHPPRGVEDHHAIGELLDDRVVGDRDNVEEAIAEKSEHHQQRSGRQGQRGKIQARERADAIGVKKILNPRQHNPEA